MNINKKIELIKQVGEEIVTEDELRHLLETKKHPIAYDGFEPSGTNIHIAQGLLRAININKMTKTGCKFKMLIADWHAWANNKMDGNLENIQKVGKFYIEVWKACGMDLKNVEFIWASDLLNNQSYWKTVMQIARKNTLKRILRTVQIMGRLESDILSASQIMYPCMQAADIFHLKVDICQLGMDQRKVSILAREIGKDLGYWKPIIVSHHMLMGLRNPLANVRDYIGGNEKLSEAELKMERMIGMKMAKSNPDSAIFMDDSEENIKRKVKKAYCPEGDIDANPILEYCKYIIFEKFDKFKVERKKEFGGDLEFKNYKELEDAFIKKEIHPSDLKVAVANYLNELLEPVRNKLEKNKTAQRLKEEIKNFKVTR